MKPGDVVHRQKHLSMARAQQPSRHKMEMSGSENLPCSDFDCSAEKQLMDRTVPHCLYIQTLSASLSLIMTETIHGTKCIRHRQSIGALIDIVPDGESPSLMPAEEAP
ncbi:MAG: hypothetical protein SVO96_10375 [Pseudomonadota bacterium]|nr:hypothetical protein [Pseudomonadota bacterium]